MYVWVAEHVNVTTGSRHVFGNIEQFNARVRNDATRAAVDYFRVVGPIEQARDPQFEIETGGNEDISPLDHGHEAGPRVHEMRILIASGDRPNVPKVSGDFCGNGCEGGQRGHHTNLILRRDPPTDRQADGDHPSVKQCGVFHFLNTSRVCAVPWPTWLVKGACDCSARRSVSHSCTACVIAPIHSATTRYSERIARCQVRHRTR